MPPAPAAGETPDPAPDAAQPIEVPVTAIGDAQAGDTVTMQVVSRDDQAGTAMVTPSADDQAPEPEGGTEGMGNEISGLKE